MHESGEVWEHGMHTVPNSQMLVPIPMGVAPRERSSSPDPAALVKSQRTTQRSAPPPRSPSPEPGSASLSNPPPAHPRDPPRWYHFADCCEDAGDADCHRSAARTHPESRKEEGSEVRPAPGAGPTCTRTGCTRTC